MRHVTPLLTLALGAGIFTGVLIDGAFTLGLSILLSAAWGIAMLAVQRQHRSLVLAACAVMAGAAGWLLGAHAVQGALNTPLRALLEARFGGFALDSSHRLLEDPILIEGRLLGDASPSDSGASLRIAVSRVWVHHVAEDVRGSVSVSVNGEPQDDVIAEWRAGRVVRAPVHLRRPARYLNIGVPDQERVLARRGITLVGSIKSAALVEVVKPGRWWEEMAAAVRFHTRAALVRHVGVYSGQSAAIATAILIGDRAGLSLDTERRLQEAGTYHVIAISGGNIAILAALLVGSIAIFGLHGRSAALLTIAGLLAYGLVASGGASVLRATLMAVVYFSVRLIDQRTAPANAIAITGAAILIVNPLQVVDVGFLFTFGATIALVYAASTIRRPADPRGSSEVLRSRLRAIARAAWMVLLATLSVELVLAPIAAFVFHRVTIAGLALNFAALPAMTVVQLTAMALVAADVVGLLEIASSIGAVTHAGATVLVGSADLLDYAPWSTWRVPSPASGILAAYYLVLCGTVMMWRYAMTSKATGGSTNGSAMPAASSARAARGLAMAAAALFIWIVAAPAARVRALGDGRLHLSMFDVGQGDCVLVTFPNGRRLLIDAGGVPRSTFDVGERVVGPALRAGGALSLDYLAITHADADHMGGALSLLRDFQPREVWWGIPVANHGPTETLRLEAARQRSAWRTLHQGHELQVGSVLLRVLHPPPPEWERQRIRNNDSLVFELRFGRVSMLLTGDIDREVEQELLRSLDLLPHVVLKVAHHGSLTSSSPAFVHAVRPAVALMGVGRGNAYGHPAPFVLGRLHDAGAEVFRTDLDGQVSITTDGERVWGTTFTGRTLRGF